MTIAMRTATPMLRSRDDAADVAQDVALDVLRSLDRLRDPRALDAWIHKIAVRRTLLTLRKRQAWVAATTATLADVGSIAVETDHDLQLSLRAALTDALATLPPRQSVALVLHYVHDMTDREIAAAMGCRRGTANALLSRGRATLREMPALAGLVPTVETNR